MNGEKGVACGVDEDAVLMECEEDALDLEQHGAVGVRDCEVAVC